MWVVRDKDNTLWLCTTKPTREKSSWSDKGDCIQIGNKFPFTQLPFFVENQEWKDTPLQIKFDIKKK